MAALVNRDHIKSGLTLYSVHYCSAMKHIGADVVLLHLLPSLSPPAVALILGADPPSSPGGRDGHNSDQAPV